MSLRRPIDQSIGPVNTQADLSDARRTSRAVGALVRISICVTLSSGWRRRAIALAAGAVGAFALPPFALLPLMAMTMTVAVWLIDGTDNAVWPRVALRQAFGSGWWLGFGYFVAGLWWIGAACLVDAGKFAWALPLSVLVLPALLAVFTGFGFAFAKLIWSTGPWRILALAFGLGLAEWGRCLLFTGFPWNDFGMTLGGHLITSQTASLVGLHGLTFLTVAIFAAPATLSPLIQGQGERLPVKPMILALLALFSMAAFGAFRLCSPQSPAVPGVKLRLMQGNIAQGPAFSPENGDAILRKYIALSERRDALGDGGLKDVTHLIWPESAFPFILSREPKKLADLADLLKSGTILLTGAARMETKGGSQPIFYNAIETVDLHGLRSEGYDKKHLVPFGEYVPFQGVLRILGLTDFVEVPGGFTAGRGPQQLQVPGLPTALPLICYEAIFPQEIGADFSKTARPGWLLNLTDDAWFGDTPGPRQHYAQARLRAIELGLPLVRTANSGISAVIDGLGREVARSRLGVEAVLDVPLPQPVPPTWQARFAPLGALVLAFAALLGAGRARISNGTFLNRELYPTRLARDASSR